MTAALRTVHTATFRAFGSGITLTGIDHDREAFDRGLQWARDLADRWEGVFSRFLPGSDLSRLNAADGRWTEVSGLFITLLEQSAAAWRETDGRFDPTILPALAAAGYHASFETIGEGHQSIPAAPVPGMAGIEIDDARSAVRMPPGVAIDFGGIGKGAWVDRVALGLMTWPGGCISAGGDLRTWGLPPAGDAWTVGIEHPVDETRHVAIVEVRDGRAASVATSARTGKAWTGANGPAHHLIDPATGQPTDGPVAACTVFSATAARAEIEAKSAFIAAARGERVSAAPGTLVVLALEDGTTQFIESEDLSDAYQALPVA